MTDKKKSGMIRIHKNDISYLAIVLIWGLFGLSSSLMGYILPSQYLQGALIMGSLLLLLMIMALNRQILRREAFLALLIAGMSVFPFVSLRTSDWGTATTFYFVSLLTGCLVLRYSLRITDLLFPVMYAAYAFYGVCTVWFYLDRNFYMTRVVWLFPENRLRLIRMYNSGCMAGLTYHYSVNGMFLAVGMLIAFSVLVWKGKRSNWLPLIFFTVCLLLTGKRAHLIFTVSACFSVYYLETVVRKDGNRARLNFIGTLLIVALLGIILISTVPAFSTFLLRFQDTMESGDITNGRLGLWRLALTTFFRHPILGIGWKNFAPLISTTYSTIRKYDVHNVFLQLLCEVGLAGSLIYYTWIFANLYLSVVNCRLYLRNCQRGRKERLYAAFSMGFQVFFFLYCITGNPLYERIMLLPYFLSCGINLYFQKHNYLKEQK